MNSITAAGAIAALGSMLSFLPQPWRIIQSRDTSSIPLGMCSFTVAGFALWMLYAIGVGEWPSMMTNCVYLLLASLILLMTSPPQVKRDAMAHALDPGK